MFVCVCVCVRERERERERDLSKDFSFSKIWWEKLVKRGHPLGSLRVDNAIWINYMDAN